MSDETVKVVLSADIQGLIQGLSQAATAVQSASTNMQASLAGVEKAGQSLSSGIQTATSKMSGAFGSLEGIVSKIKGPFIALGALLGGGAIFKGAIQATISWNGEAMKMAKTLGITTEQASILNLALGDIYSSSETYLAAANKMVMGINSGGEGFKKLGIETHDSNGKLKDTGPLMQETLDRLNKITEGTQRNSAGLSIFGKSWGEASKLLKLNAEVMEEARLKAERLHLIVGPDGVAMTKAYKAAMNDVEDVMQSLKVQVGSALLPILVKLGAFMGEHGPKMAEGLGYAIKGVITVFYTLKAVIETITIIITALITTMIEGWTMAAKIIYNVMTGNLKGAIQAGKEGASAIKNEWVAAGEGIATAWTDMAKNTKDLWSNKPPAASKEREEKGGYDGGAKEPEKAKSKLPEFEKELQARKAMLAEKDGDLATMSEKDERAFWEGKLSIAKKGSDDWIQIRLKMASLGQTIDKNIKAAQEEERKAIEQELLEAAKVAEGIAKATAKEKIDAAMDAYTQEAASLKDLLDLKQITHTQYTQMLQAALARDKALEVAAINEQIEAYRKIKPANAKEQERLNLDIRKMGEQRLQTERKINMEANQIEKEHAMNVRTTWMGVMNGITSGWDKGLAKMLKGQMKFSQGIKAAWAGIKDYALNSMINMALEWAKQKVTMLAVQAAFDAGLITRQTATALAGTQVQLTQDRIKQASAATVGGANASASAASNGPYGWIIALAAGAAVMAGIMAMSSAAGGWDQVPGDQIAQIHKDEMVMSAPLAEGIRNMVAAGNEPKPNQGGGGGTTYNVHALDAKSFKQVVGRQSNSRSLTKAIQAHVKKGGSFR